MKSLLVTSGTQKATLGSLAKGDYAIVKSDGSVLATTASIPTTGMYKYVVGLGNGKTIEGLWLNAANKKVELQEYEAGAVNKVAIFAKDLDATLLTDAEVHIQVQPKSSLSGLDYQEFVAVVPVTSTTQDLASVKTQLEKEINKVIEKINKYFPTAVLKVGTGETKESAASGAATSWLDFEALNTDFTFHVNFGGAISGTVVESNGLTFGTQAQIIKLEKEMAIATFGYNPNFEAGDQAYGEVLLASDFGSAGYDIVVITSTAPATDAMPLHAGAAKVEQWIAVPKDNSVKA